MTIPTTLKVNKNKWPKNHGNYSTYFRGPGKALRTHMFEAVGPKDHTRKGFEAFLNLRVWDVRLIQDLRVIRPAVRQTL